MCQLTATRIFCFLPSILPPLLLAKALAHNPIASLALSSLQKSGKTCATAPLLTMPICDVGGCSKCCASPYALFLPLPRDVSGCGQAAAVEKATASHVCGILKTSYLEESVAPGAHLRSISLLIGLHLVTPSTPGALVPSSASKQARRLSPVKRCIRAVHTAPGSLRARLAMGSIPVVAVAPPLRVARMAIEPAPHVPPLSNGCRNLRHYPGGY